MSNNNNNKKNLVYSGLSRVINGQAYGVISGLKSMLYMHVCIYRKTTGKKLSNILAKISLDGETVAILIYPL